MPAGRPTSYNPEYADKLEAYFNIDSGYDTEFERKDGSVVSVRHANNLPTLAGFARELGIHRQRLHDWSTQTDENGNLLHPELADALKRAKDHQERILIENGLKGGYQQAFAIFTAKNVLNWRDQQNIEHTGKDGKDLIPEADDMEVARRAAFLFTKAAIHKAREESREDA